MSGSDSAARSAIGWLLLVLASLWLLLTGGCTLFFLVLPGSIATPMSLLMTIGIAAVSMAPGALLFWAGWGLVRRR